MTCMASYNNEKLIAVEQLKPDNPDRCIVKLHLLIIDADNGTPREFSMTLPGDFDSKDVILGTVNESTAVALVGESMFLSSLPKPADPEWVWNGRKILMSAWRSWKRVTHCVLTEQHFLILVDRDNNIWCVDLRSGERSTTPISAHFSRILSILYVVTDSGMLVTAERDLKIRVAPLFCPPEILWYLLGHRAAVTALASMDSGRLLASGSLDNTIRLWLMDEGSELFVWEREDLAIRMLRSNGLDLLAACGFESNVIYLLRMTNQRLVLERAIEADAYPCAMEFVGDRLFVALEAVGVKAFTLSDNSGEDTGASWSSALSSVAHVSRRTEPCIKQLTSKQVSSNVEEYGQKKKRKLNVPVNA